MSKQTWTLIKQNKNFNVRIYRLGLTLLYFALLFNIVLGILIAYVHLHQPERDFYATSGVAPPVQLKPLASANMGPEPLLEPDPPTDERERIIPQ